MLTTRPRGTGDIIPGQVEMWHHLEKTAMAVCQSYGYSEIRTPLFEHTELFVRGVGEDTDIVEKEMYTFLDRGQRSITLRPEGTAPVVRAYLENKLYAGPQPVKLYYIGPMFRYDRPQAGRYRQFNQFGVEAFGSHHPALDAEVMALAMDFYSRLGLTNLDLHVNSVGCSNCRPKMRRKLQEHFKPTLDDFCVNCRQRYNSNPLRILDCKTCTGLTEKAPVMQDYLCPDCNSHLTQVLQYMQDLGIPYTMDPHLVRGLDYYTHTAFEIMAPGIGAQSSVGGGGRYNGLVEACGGPSIPGIGFALGLERIILAMEHQSQAFNAARGLEVFVVTTGDELTREGFVLLAQIRAAGIAAGMDYQGRSLKAQMKYVGKQGVRFALILGESELQRDCAILRDMKMGSQKELPLAGLVQKLKSELKDAEKDFAG